MDLGKVYPNQLWFLLNEENHTIHSFLSVFFESSIAIETITNFSSGINNHLSNDIYEGRSNSSSDLIYSGLNRYFFPHVKA